MIDQEEAKRIAKQLTDSMNATLDVVEDMAKNLYKEIDTSKMTNEDKKNVQQNVEDFMKTEPIMEEARRRAAEVDLTNLNL